MTRQDVFQIVVFVVALAALAIGMKLLRSHDYFGGYVCLALGGAMGWLLRDTA